MVLAASQPGMRYRSDWEAPIPQLVAPLRALLRLNAPRALRRHVEVDAWTESVLTHARFERDAKRPLSALGDYLTVLEQDYENKEARRAAIDILREVGAQWPDPETNLGHLSACAPNKWPRRAGSLNGVALPSGGWMTDAIAEAEALRKTGFEQPWFRHTRNHQ